MFKIFKSVKTKEEKRQQKNERLLLILSGVLLGISFPPVPFPFTVLMFFGFIPYFFVLRNRKNLASVNSATFLMNFVFCVITVYWVGSWQPEADTFLMIAGAALLFALPSVLLIPSTLFYMARKNFPKLNTFYFFPLFWVTAEYLLTLTDLQFPWLTLGQGLAKFTSFIQIADITGTFGLSLIVIFINVFLFKLILRYKLHKKIHFGFTLLSVSLFTFVIIYGVVKINSFQISDRKTKVGLIQPDLNPWKKWENGNLNDILNLYFELSDQAIKKGAQIIFWPETALPVYAFGGNYPELTRQIHAFVDSNNIYLLTGMPHIVYHHDKNNIPDDAKMMETSKVYYSTYNAMIMVKPFSKEIEYYGKMKLVPMGERVPFVDDLKFLGDIFKWGVGITGWNIGKDTTVFKINLNKKDTVNISGLVCYESVFPQFIPYFVQNGAQMISVVTNDSWYGNSSGPYQHKDFAILRAVENRRSVVRCANGGVSCIINALGEIESETEMFKKTVLVGDVPIQNELTFYSKYPLIFPVLCSIFSLWIFGISILFWLKQKFKL